FFAFFFFSSRRRHTRSYGDWSSDVCSSDLLSERLHLYQTTSSVSSQSKHKATAHPYHVDITKLRQQLRPEQCLLAYFMFQEKLRSEERRVGKECRCRWSPCQCRM